MKTILISLAMIIVLSIFSVFQIDNNMFTLKQEHLKYTADDCAAAAALFYDQEEYAEGIKIYNKAEGNEAIAFILKNNLNLNSDLSSNNPYLKDQFKYYTYYFDGDGTMSTYKGDLLISGETQVELPFLFKEDLTGYEQMIYEATVVVTIDAGGFDYRLAFIDDPECIRTSGYEYWQNF